MTRIISNKSMVQDKETKVLISASRDSDIIIWNVQEDEGEQDQDWEENTEYGTPFLKLTGHSHFVTDLSLTNNSQYLLSSS